VLVVKVCLRWHENPRGRVSARKAMGRGPEHVTSDLPVWLAMGRSTGITDWHRGPERLVEPDFLVSNQRSRIMS
jgi:hypothetical protein